MAKKKLRSSADSSALSILIIGLTIVIVGCFLGITYLFEYDFYDKDNNGETAKSVAVQIYSLDDCEKAKDFYKCMLVEQPYRDEYRLNYYSDYFSSAESNFIFAVYNMNGDLQFEGQNGGYTYELAKEQTKYIGDSDFFSIDANGAMVPLKLNYAVIINEDSVNDRYKSAFDWIDIADTLKYFAFIVLFLALLAMVILLCIITINAGTTDPVTGEIVPGFVDKIPLDVCTVAVILFFAVAMTVIGLTAAADVDMVLNNLVVVITFVTFIMLLMSYLTTVSVRFKMGKFYKNTLIYMIYRKFKRKTPRKVRKAFGDMSFFGKIILGISAYIIFEAAILAIMVRAGIYDREGADAFTLFLVVWGMTRLLIIPIFVMVAINLNYIREEGERLAGGILDIGVTDKLSIAAFKSHGKNLDQIRKEINKAMEQELKSERLKSELITNVSHDIKTPLTSIKNYVGFLNDDNLTYEERKTYVSIISKHTDKLSMLLNDLIEASKIQSGNIEINLEKTSLNIVLEQTVEEFAIKLEQSLLIPRIDIPMDDIYILGDGHWLWRIFANLINNACKYALPETDLEIQLKKIENKARICISNVSNAEISVEGNELFERFVRGDFSRHTDGHGLGLSIARSLAEMQGGTMDISVTGNKFSVILDFDITE